MLKELEPGLNISRLSEADFLNFVRLATYCTRYVRLREVSVVGGVGGCEMLELHGPVRGECCGWQPWVI